MRLHPYAYIHVLMSVWIFDQGSILASLLLFF